MKKVAVIGTGIMGAGIAHNFLKNKYQTFVWNRNKNKLKQLIKKDAIAANSPKEATEQADLIFEVTANDESSQAVWLKEDGILAGANPNKTLITCATLSIPWTDKLAKLCSKKGLTFFDMPMTGSRVGAETGRLVLMVGGYKEILKKISKDLKAISEEVIYLGQAGKGMRYKLLLNTLQSIHVLGMGEVLNLSKKIGLDTKIVGDALAKRPGGAATNMAWQNYQKEPEQTNFALEWMNKDLKYTKQMAKNFNTPLLNQCLKKFKAALKRNWHQENWTVINKLP